jgi:hypothetical protein
MLRGGIRGVPALGNYILCAMVMHGVSLEVSENGYLARVGSYRNRSGQSSQPANLVLRVL